MVVPSASQSISKIWPIIIPIVVIPLISSSAKGPISGCKILFIPALIPGPTLIYLWFIWGLFSVHSHFHVAV